VTVDEGPSVSAGAAADEANAITRISLKIGDRETVMYSNAAVELRIPFFACEEAQKTKYLSAIRLPDLRGSMAPCSGIERGSSDSIIDAAGA
jgi:hypothetical protein